MREILDALLAIFRLPLTAIVRIAVTAGIALLRWGRQVSLWQWLFAFASIGQLVVLFLPWIWFDANFLGVETFFAGTANKLLFALPFVVAMLFLVVSLRWNRYIYYLVAIVSASIYLVGFWYPNPIHTGIVDRNEYEFHLNIYLYGGFLALALLTAWAALARPFLAIQLSLFEPVEPPDDCPTWAR